MLLSQKTYLSLVLAHICVLVYVSMLKCMQAGERAHMCRAKVDVGCHPEPRSPLFLETKSFSEHSDLTGVVATLPQGRSPFPT